MKLIKWLAIWLALGFMALVGMAQAVDRSFAEYWAQVVLGVSLGMGILCGFSGLIRASGEKKKIRQAMTYLAESRDRRGAWAKDAQSRAAQVRAKCQANGEKLGENPLFASEYTSDALLEQVSRELAVTAQLQSALGAAVQTMEEEGGTV